MKKLVVGIDIGGTHTVFGLVNQEGECLVQDSLYTKDFKEFESFIQALSKGIKKLTLKGEEKFNLLGIGIGAPNANHSNCTIQNASNLQWEGVLPLGEMMEKELGLPVKVTNDANAAALAEMYYGGAKGMKNFIVLTLGTGLGSGIVINNQVLYGHSGFAGEMGHMIVRPEGRHCGCGRYGCLETYVSATGIKRTISKLFAKYCYESELRNIPFNRMSAKQIANAAYGGDQIAIEAFEFTGKILGIALANVIAVNNPEAIFLAGGLAKAGDLILKPSRYHMEENMLPIYRGKTSLHLTSVKGNSGILGSAAMLWKQIE
ncbi:ROK family protein [Ancylomarina longa]|uniref:ROK family protein n=1 Tax=Ancylomarina longa TaxID=2487017 RepID=A0A434AWI3_9BACT|nr:ROK family protein [Ancylomarina longa]RUT78842.1 ROK family protein [Ancylomarina longa]